MHRTLLDQGPGHVVQVQHRGTKLLGQTAPENPFVLDIATTVVSKAGNLDPSSAEPLAGVVGKQQ